jgi:Family of unknown function (DUF6042)
MPSTRPLEGWDQERRDALARAVISEGWAGHLPTIGVLLLGYVPTCQAPPTRDELTRMITQRDNPTGSWDGPAWEEPKLFTAEELAELDRQVPWPSTDPDRSQDPDEVNAQERAHFEAHRARVDRHAAHYGLPPVRTCRDTLELLLAAGLLHRVIEGGAIRFRPSWPMPLVEDVFPLTPEERAEEDRHRWQDLHYRTGQRIIALFEPLADNRKDTLTTSLDRLGRKLSLDPDSVREGILVLLGEGDFSVNVDIARVSRHKVFTLRVDWERFARTRIGISAG